MRIKNIDGIILNSAIYIDTVDNVGFGISIPSERIHINGALIVGEHELLSPLAGTVEWDGINFRGFDGTIWKNLDESGGAPILGIPTDGGFGLDINIEGEISGITTGDTMDDAFDKIESVLALLAPARPPDLTDVTISIPNLYVAREHITGLVTTNITDDTTPTGTISTYFGDASNGTISAYVDTILDGFHTFTSADDTGANNGGLLIIAETVLDNFWQQCTASLITTSAFTPGTVTHNYELEHTITGSTDIDFHIDDLQVAPLLTFISATGIHTSAKRISGVPTLSTSDSIQSSFLADGTVSYYYHQTRICRVESSYVSTSDIPFTSTLVSGIPISTTPPTRNDQIDITSYASTVLNNVYTEDVTITYRAYTANNTMGSVASGSTDIRIDTKSDETIRVKSGSGQYPVISLSGTTSTTNASDCGSPYNSNESLELNEELLLLNTNFQFPAATSAFNYTGNLPTAGPDYSDLSTAHITSHGGLRWVTFSMGSVTAVNSFTFTLSDSSGFTGVPLETGGVEMYLNVEGDTDWVNANAAYPGAGSPQNNGDPALDVGSSTATVKRVTFGTTPRTGTVYVRIGIPFGSGKTFKDII